MSEYLSGRKRNLNIGIRSYTENDLVLDVIGNTNITGVTSLASAGGITTTGGDLYVGGDVNVSGVITAISFIGNFIGSIDTAINVVGGIGSLSSLVVSGVSTLGVISSTNLTSQNLNVSGITTVGFLTASNIRVSGIVTAPTFVGNLTGIASTATKLETTRTFQITGDIVAPPQNFDGTANVSFASSIQPNTVGLGTHTYGDYVKNITGTTGEIEVSVTSGEGVSPQIGLPDNVTISDSLRVVKDVQIDRNLNVTGNITIGGTSAYLSVENLVVKDRDIIIGFVTDAYGNDASTDISANTGGIAIASTEGSPLVNLNVVGFETLPPTYKKIMWFKANTLAGLNTDAWMFNYGVGIGSTQIPNGVRLAVGGVQVTDSDIIKIRNINASGIITATTFVGNLTGTATTAINVIGGIGSLSSLSVSGVTTVGFLTASNISVSGVVTATTFYGNLTGGTADIATYATNAGISTYATYATNAGIATSVIGGIGSLSSLSVSGISTLGITSTTDLTTRNLRVSGITTVGFLTASNISVSGVVTATTFYGNLTGGTADIATYATSSGIATYSTSSGIATYATSAGIATYSTSSGIATYATSAGISTNVIGGIASVTSLSVSGISTLGTVKVSSGIVTATSGIVTYYGDGSKLTGVSGFNIVTQEILTNPVYLTFVENIGVSSIGISTNKLTFIPSSGNLGIGTTNATSRLSVVGDGLFTGVVTATSFSGTATIATNVVGGIGSVSSLRVTGFSTLSNISVASSIFDSTNSSGVSQYVLTSTPSGVLWQSVSGVGAITGINVGSSSVDSSFNIGFFNINSGTTANAFVAPSDLTYNPSRTFVGIGTTNPTSKLTISSALRSQALGIGSEFIVSNTGSFVPSVSIAATIGSGTTEKVLLRSISRNQGTLDVVSNYRQTQMMNVSDTNSEGVFRVTALETSTVAFVAPIYRQLLVVGESGIVTTRNAVAIATANATGASGTVGADIYGNVNIRSPFSTSTSYVAIAPNFRDNGALSFEAPIGAASTNSVTQLFSITNNVSSSIFRINDLNRNPILEANVAGNIGIGTTSPQRKLEIQGITRITSVGSTANEQIDIRHYRNISGFATVGMGSTSFLPTNNSGAISFESPVGYSSFTSSLFAIVNDPNGSIFSIAGFNPQRFASDPRIPALEITQVGNVGLGTTNPVSKFHIIGNTRNIGNVGIGTTIVDTSRDFTSSSGVIQRLSTQIAGAARITSLGSTTLSQIDIKHQSNPGINTLAPSRGAVFFDGLTDTFATNFDGGQLVTITNDNTSSIFSVNRFVPGVAGLSSANPTNTRTIETVVNVTSGGNIGIGTTNPLQRIQVGTGSSAITVNSLGSVGIGTTNPQAKLDVSADALISGLTIGKGTGSVSSNTALGYQALLSNTTGTYNTATGFQALYSNTTGTLNTANGYLALFSNTTGTKNTANGGGSLYSNTTGTKNTVTGYTALYSNTTGTNNTATGYLSLYSNTTGSYNTANGHLSLRFNTTGTFNTATGYEALRSNTTGTNNTATGLQALYSNTIGTSNTANGVYALYYNTTGTNNTATGYGALLSNTTGILNTATGVQALYFNTGNYNTANGYRALYTNTNGYFNTATGTSALNFNTTGRQNTATGVNALYSNTTGNANTANGVSALQANTGGTNNTANGVQALYANIGGSSNVANGYRALFSNTTGSGNVANGTGALRDNTTGSYNTANGQNALASNTTGSNNTATGQSALGSNTTGTNNTANGYRALLSNTTGYYNIADGSQALASNTTGIQNTATGYAAIGSNTTGSNNTANGYRALAVNTTGTSNTATGVSALRSNTTGTNNTANGYQALYSNTTGTNNTANGQQALYNNTTGTLNTATGRNALYNNTTGTLNTANGYAALYSNTTGTPNTATGSYALRANTTGSNNTANGYRALNSNTTASNNTAVGVNALYYNTTGTNNTATGYAALQANTTGINNTAIGYNAGYNITTGSNNSFLGYNAQPSAVSVSNEITLGDTNVDTLRVPGLGYYGVRTNTTVATTSATTIDSIVVATYRSARIQIQITQGTNYQVSDVLLIHDGTTASIIEYGTLATGSTLGTYSATISSGNALLQVNMGSATSSAVKVLSYRTVV